MKLKRFNTVITRPQFQTVPLAAGLQWQDTGEFIYEEKMDGVWKVQEFQVSGIRYLIAGEQMRGGEFYAFDLLEYAGQDLRPLPLCERRAALADFVGVHASACPPDSLKAGLQLPATGAGGAFLSAVLARGGEGIVAKRLDAPWGATWWKCKRIETFDLLVLEKHAGGKSSIRLGAPPSTIDPRLSTEMGWCPCRAAFDRVHVGDIVEISAFGLTSAGKLREPRFMRIRHDKCLRPDTI